MKHNGADRVGATSNDAVDGRPPDARRQVPPAQCRVDADPAAASSRAREPAPADQPPADESQEQRRTRSAAGMLRGASAVALVWAAAALIGAIGGLVAVGFRSLIAVTQWIGTGHTGGLVATALALEWWQRLLVPLGGGLAAGLLQQWGKRWAQRGPQGDRHIDYLDAARSGDATLNDRTTLARSASALLSIGSGASIGREGPMVQLAAWAAARAARWLPVPAEQRATLLACGIAAGFGTAYHAPIAGVVFVLELALGTFARQRVEAVLIAAVSATAVVFGLTDVHPVYTMPRVDLTPASLPLAAVFGIASGLLGWLVLALLQRSRQLFAALRAPWLRLGAGGLAVGALSAAVPEVWGNGYAVVSDLLHGNDSWHFVALILAAKIVATLASAGSGAVGGMFTPMLFVGAAGGYLFAVAGGALVDPALAGDPRVLGVIGMAAVLSAVTHAPITSIVVVLEMTNQFQLTAPVMLACAVAYAISARFGTRPLYGNPIEGRP